MQETDPDPDPDSIIAIYIVILVLLVFLSAFFSATETAFSSINRARLKVRAQNGGKRAKVAFDLSEKFDKVLFTLLIGNNIVNITATTIGTLLFIRLINAQAGPTVATIVLTVVILIFGEIFPKLVGRSVPESFAIWVAPIVKFFMIILYPICIIFTGLNKLFSKFIKTKPNDSITDEELRTIVEEANEDGAIEDSESELINNAIDFHDCEVGDILVPRVNVIAVPIDMPMEKIKAVFKKNAYSRIPVYNNTIDTIIGMIHEKDFMAAFDRGDKNISGIIKKTALATEHMRISTLLRSMQKSKVHLAVVIDEYGGTLGIVTLEDILEELVGEIWDEHDEVVEYFDKIDDKNYRIDGNADINDFFELFSINPDKEDCDSQTVSGWVIEKLGDLPKKNDSFEFQHLRIIVTRCSQKRVYEIKVIILDEDDLEREPNEDFEQNAQVAD